MLNYFSLHTLALAAETPLGKSPVISSHFDWLCIFCIVTAPEWHTHVCTVSVSSRAGPFQRPRGEQLSPVPCSPWNLPSTHSWEGCRCSQGTQHTHTHTHTHTLSSVCSMWHIINWAVHNGKPNTWYQQTISSIFSTKCINWLEHN